MGVSGKVASLIAIVILGRMVCMLCMPKNINRSSATKYLNLLKEIRVSESPSNVTVPIRNLKKPTRIAYRPKFAQSKEARKHLLNKRKHAPNVYNSITNTEISRNFQDFSISEGKHSDSKNLLEHIDVSPLVNKLKKEIKKKLIKSIQNAESHEKYQADFKPDFDPFCFKDIGSYPEVEYPLSAFETWAPNYWNNQPYVKSNDEHRETDRDKTSNYLNSLTQLLHSKGTQKENNKKSATEVINESPINADKDTSSINVENILPDSSVNTTLLTENPPTSRETDFDDDTSSISNSFVLVPVDEKETSANLPVDFDNMLPIAETIPIENISSISSSTETAKSSIKDPEAIIADNELPTIDNPLLITESISDVSNVTEASLPVLSSPEVLAATDPPSDFSDNLPAFDASPVSLDTFPSANSILLSPDNLPVTNTSNGLSSPITETNPVSSNSLPTTDIPLDTIENSPFSKTFSVAHEIPPAQDILLVSSDTLPGINTPPASSGSSPSDSDRLLTSSENLPDTNNLPDSPQSLPASDSISGLPDSSHSLDSLPITPDRILNPETLPIPTNDALLFSNNVPLTDSLPVSTDDLPVSMESIPLTDAVSLPLSNSSFIGGSKSSEIIDPENSPDTTFTNESLPISPNSPFTTELSMLSDGFSAIDEFPLSPDSFPDTDTVPVSSDSLAAIDPLPVSSDNFAAISSFPDSSSIGVLSEFPDTVFAPYISPAFSDILPDNDIIPTSSESLSYTDTPISPGSRDTIPVSTENSIATDTPLSSLDRPPVFESIDDNGDFIMPTDSMLEPEPIVDNDTFIQDIVTSPPLTSYSLKSLEKPDKSNVSNNTSTVECNCLNSNANNINNLPTTSEPDDSNSILSDFTEKCLACESTAELLYFTSTTCTSEFTMATTSLPDTETDSDIEQEFLTSNDTTATTTSTTSAPFGIVTDISYTDSPSTDAMNFEDVSDNEQTTITAYVSTVEPNFNTDIAESTMTTTSLLTTPTDYLDIGNNTTTEQEFPFIEDTTATSTTTIPSSDIGSEIFSTSSPYISTTTTNLEDANNAETEDTTVTTTTAPSSDIGSEIFSTSSPYISTTTANFEDANNAETTTPANVTESDNPNTTETVTNYDHSTSPLDNKFTDFQMNTGVIPDFTPQADQTLMDIPASGTTTPRTSLPTNTNPESTTTLPPSMKTEDVSHNPTNPSLPVLDPTQIPYASTLQSLSSNANDFPSSLFLTKLIESSVPLLDSLDVMLLKFNYT